MFLVTTQPKNSIGGPLWFIQLWAYAYFPQLAPKPNPSIFSKCACYAHLFALSVYEPNHIPHYGDWFNLFFDKERVRSAPNFHPFVEAKFTCPKNLHFESRSESIILELMGSCPSDQGFSCFTKQIIWF